MPMDTIRVGIVGAGGNTRLRHVPGFRVLEGVELLGVVNRTAESTERAAREFAIPRTYSDWRSLIDDEEIDAVLIGTWPNLHCEVTCAAIEAGKHVLCEARMARTAAEAHRMLATAERHPHVVRQIVPSPFGLVQDAYVRQLIEEGFLGEVRELVVIGADASFTDSTQPLHWRQDVAISGHNLLAMGILHETALRWSPPPVRVFAQTRIVEATRTAGDGTAAAAVTVPDSVQIVTVLENGGRGLYHLSGVSHFGPGKQIHLYGSRGTIKYIASAKERLLIGAAGDSELREVEIPPEQLGGWRVEEEFINAIRGDEPVRFTDFATGVRYMEFTTAVHRSAEQGRPVNLPLEHVNDH